MKMTASKLTPKRAKKVAKNLAVLIEKSKVISDMQDAAKDKEGAALEEAGFNMLKKFMDFAFNEEYDLIIEIIADLFGKTVEEAEEIPLEDIFDFVLKDRVVCSFFPRLALDAKIQ